MSNRETDPGPFADRPQRIRPATGANDKLLAELTQRVSHLAGAAESTNRQLYEIVASVLGQDRAEDAVQNKGPVEAEPKQPGDPGDLEILHNTLSYLGRQMSRADGLLRELERL